MLYGARVSLAVGFVSVGIAAAIGIVLGSLAGYHGGTTDAMVMRLVDPMLGFPRFFLPPAGLPLPPPSRSTNLTGSGLTRSVSVAPLRPGQGLVPQRRAGGAP